MFSPRLLVPLFSVLAALVVAAPAHARLTVGFSEQKPTMFTDARFQALGVKHSRLVMSYDAVLRGGWQRAEVDVWLAAARAAGSTPMVAFNHRRGHSRYLPSVKQYVKGVRAFRARYPWVRTFTTWNEANHSSQPLYRKPKRAAQFYNALRKQCRGCTIVAADVLDQSNMGAWLRTFKRYAKGKPRLWGLHNYVDANRFVPFKKSGTRKLLRLVKGKVWLTEAGGIVRFTRYKHNETRAGKAVKRTFALARKYRSRISRLYLYHWQADPDPKARWDSAFIDRKGHARKHFKVLRQQLRKVHVGR